MEDGNDPSSAFLDALRTRAMDEMHDAALEYGIVLKDLGISFVILSHILGLTDHCSCYRPAIQGRNRRHNGQAHELVSQAHV